MSQAFEAGWGSADRRREISKSDREQAAEEKRRIGLEIKNIIALREQAKREGKRDPLPAGIDEILRKFLQELSQKNTPAEVLLYEPKFKQLYGEASRAKLENKTLAPETINNILQIFPTPPKSPTTHQTKGIRPLGESIH